VLKKIIRLLLLTLLLLTSIPSVTANNYYCGYWWEGEATAAPYGVSGYIYTNNKFVPTGEMLAQWVAVQMSYSLDYFVQIGFQKGVNNGYVLDWYVEKVDSSGYSIWWGDDQFEEGTPSSSTYYTYYIWLESSPTRWAVYVNPWSEAKAIYTSTYSSVDLQAFSETTDDDICIDDTHFDYLSYPDNNDWNLWDQHLKWDDSDYYCYQDSDYEFHGDGP